MRFTPQSERQAEAQGNNLLDPGIYDFEVREASEEVSSAGNEMIKLEIIVYTHDGSRRVVYDYLVNTEKAQFKIRHFSEACGMLKQYKSGMLMANEIVGRTGKLHIINRPARGEYGPSNSVRDYVRAEDAAAQQMEWPTSPPNQRKPIAAGKGSDLEDDIPFGPCWQ